MAKWIKETFTMEVPDYYLSQERTKDLTQEWTYEGPRKVAVLIWKNTNTLAWDHGVFPLTDKKDRTSIEEEWERLKIHAGLDMYPVELSFESDPVLISCLVYNGQKQTLQKEYYWDGTDAIHPKDEVTFDDGSPYWNKKNDWAYCHEWPMFPDHVIELTEIKYDPDRKEFVKPYPWKKPHITPHEFLYYYYSLIEDMRKFCDDDIVDLHPDVQVEFYNYLSELESLQDKIQPFIDRPWMINLPPDPRYKQPNFNPVHHFCVMDDFDRTKKLEVTKQNLGELAESISMEIPEGFDAPY